MDDVTIEVLGARLRIRRSGERGAPPVLFVHGWPESSALWAPVMELAAGAGFDAIALDLPGVGGSTRASDGPASSMAAAELATVLQQLSAELNLDDPSLVGHDLGGMVAYAALRHAPAFGRVAIMNTVVPGVAPWDRIWNNPYVWHFRFHAIPELPETVVTGRERAYFDYFFDLLSADPASIPDAYRDLEAAAYGSREALRAGFDGYRALPQDAETNAAETEPVDTPVLFVRGEAERVDVAEYEAGLRAAGVSNLRSALLPASGHFSPIDAPDATWAALLPFLRG